MKVLIISVRADIGGGPEHIHQLVSHSDSEIVYTIACPEDKPYYKRFESLVSAERMVSIPHRKFKLSTLFALRKRIRQSNINLIHSHGKGAGIYSRLLTLLTRIPTIHTFHGLHIDDYGHTGRFLYIWLERVLSLLTRAIITVSKGEGDALRKHRIAPAKKIQLIENGIPVPDYCPPEVKSPKIIELLAVNRFNRQKNPELLLEIVDRLKERASEIQFKLKILGDGEQFNQIQAEVHKRQLSEYITLLGPKDNPREYYRRAYCFLSTSRWEGMPLAPLEAMSEGTPVVASDVVGNRDIISDGENGFLFPVDDPGMAAELIERLAGDLSLRNRIARSGYEMVRTSYHIQSMTDRTISLYRSI